MMPFSNKQFRQHNNTAPSPVSSAVRTVLGVKTVAVSLSCRRCKRSRIIITSNYLYTCEWSEPHAAGSHDDAQYSSSILQQHHISAGVSCLHHWQHKDKRNRKTINLIHFALFKTFFTTILAYYYCVTFVIILIIHS